jgi:glyoxylase-like metal-dependent hydrolase (beta-lactamase superfamily II)
VFWEGDTREIGDGLTLINAGVHFAGGQVLHRRDGDGGTLFSGDILQVVRDRRWVSFMYSYPNLIPERPRVIRRALSLLEPYAFDRVYGAWWRLVVETDGRAAVRSLRRPLFILRPRRRPGRGGMTDRRLAGDETVRRATRRRGRRGTPARTA